MEAPVLEHFGLTDTGLRRSENEDSIAIDPEAMFFAVCDGLGGQNAGEVASRLAAETLQVFIQKSQERDITWPYGLAASLSFDGNRLSTAITLANKKVLRAADAREDYTGMGTTVVAAIARGSLLTVAWVGDSRAYLIRDGVAKQLTQDHTWINMVSQHGALRPEEAAHQPGAHVLVRAVGGQESVAADVVETELRHDDTVLLCSDGLTTMVKDEEIATLLTPSPGSAEAGARKLVEAANAAGGKDNISVILLRYVDTQR
jgi:protein phosphatase